MTTGQDERSLLHRWARAVTDHPIMAALTAVALIFSTVTQILGGFSAIGGLLWPPAPPQISAPVEQPDDTTRASRAEFATTDDCFYVLFAPVVIDNEFRASRKLTFDGVTREISNADAEKGLLVQVKKPGRYEYEIEHDTGSNPNPLIANIFASKTAISLDGSNRYYLVSTGLTSRDKPISRDEANEFVRRWDISVPACGRAARAVTW